MTESLNDNKKSSTFTDLRKECSVFPLTFHKEGANCLPQVWVVVENDAVLMHSNALQPALAAKPGDVVTVLHNMEHD